MCGGSLTRQLRVNNSVEHTRLLWRLRARSARTGRVLAIRESLAPSCNLKSARWRCVASLRVTLCIDMRRFRLRVLATLLRRSDCSLTRACTPEQTRIQQARASQKNMMMMMAQQPQRFLLLDRLAATRRATRQVSAGRSFAGSMSTRGDQRTSGQLSCVLDEVKGDDNEQQAAGCSYGCTKASH